MPMTAAIAPEFSRRYPEVAIIFDNLHAMHDVISDVLADASIPRGRKRAEILLAARRYRDDTTAVTSEAEWREMAIAMGVAEQGGPAVVVTGPAPRGDTASAAAHAGHAPRADSTAARDPARSAAPDTDAVVDGLMALLEDSVIRSRIVADTALRRAMERTIRALPSEHRDHLLGLLGSTQPPPSFEPSRSAPPASAGSRRP
jgi:hypothetical protein